MSKSVPEKNFESSNLPPSSLSFTARLMTSERSLRRCFLNTESHEIHVQFSSISFAEDEPCSCSSSSVGRLSSHLITGW